MYDNKLSYGNCFKIPDQILKVSLNIDMVLRLILQLAEISILVDLLLFTISLFPKILDCYISAYQRRYICIWKSKHVFVQGSKWILKRFVTVHLVLDFISIMACICGVKLKTYESPFDFGAHIVFKDAKNYMSFYHKHTRYC